MSFKGNRQMRDYTNRNNSASTTSYGVESKVSYDAGLRSYMQKVYNYMAIALVITGVIAMAVASSSALMGVIHGTPLKYVVMFAPLVFVLLLGNKMMTMSKKGAQIAFWSFSALMGLSLSYIFVVYTGESITKVFFMTSATFASMSVYGYTTKKDLTGLGSLAIMAVFGIIIASIINLFLHSSGLSFAISIIGVLAFVALTAYDTQKIKEVYSQVAGTPQADNVAIMGALTLYLDFINLMILLLRLFGNRD